MRWKYGTPPAGNANFAWVQHFIHHLAPKGLAGFVLANGSMSSNQSGEGEIRKAIIEADLVDCMVALPGQLFYSTQIPVCLWFLARDKKNGRFRDRRGKTLFIDARKLGTLIDRVHRELTDDDIQHDRRHLPRLARRQASVRSPSTRTSPGFCKSATLDEIRQHGHILTPGRYVGAEEVEDDGEPFDEKMARLTAELREQTTAIRQARQAHLGQSGGHRLWRVSEANFLPGTWRLCRLDDVADIIDCLHKTPVYSNTGRPMVQSPTFRVGFLRRRRTPSA